MKKIIDKRNDIAFYLKIYIGVHPQARDTATSIVCEKSLALLDDAFAKKEVPKPKCKTTAIDDNLQLGKKIGITGVPAIILPNGVMIPGYKDADSLISLIEKNPAS